MELVKKNMYGGGGHRLSHRVTLLLMVFLMAVRWSSKDDIRFQ